MTLLAKTRVGKGYRTTVPREIRKILGIGLGNDIDWFFDNGKIIIRRGEKSD